MLLTQFTSRCAAEVAASAPEVFDVLTDVGRLPAWNARIDRVIDPGPDPMCVGAVWVVQIKLAVPPVTWPSRATCTAYDPAALVFAHRSVTDDGNPSFVEWRWHVVALDAGRSRVEVTWSVSPRTFWRRLLLARMRRRQLPSEVSASLAALSAALVGSGVRRS